MLPQQYCLRWKYHHSNLQSMFSQLLDRGCFCDVTIACGGQTLKAHRVVLCACSTYFDSLLTNCCTEKDPIIIMRDAKYSDVKCLIEFMYKGEINVEYSNLASLLKTAEELKIKGLAEVSWRDEETTTTNSSNNNNNNDDISNNKNNNLLNNNNNYQDNQEINKITSNNNHHSHSFNQNNSNNNQKRQNRLSSPTILTSVEHNLNFEHNSSSTNSAHPVPMLAPLNSPKKSDNSNCGSPINYAGGKKKRGRPPLDEEYDTYASHAKISHLDSNTLHQYTDSSHLVTVMMDDNSRGELNKDETLTAIHQQQQQRHRQRYQDDDEEDDDQDQNNHANAPPLNDENEDSNRKQLLHNMQQYDPDQIPAKIIPKLERPDTPMDYLMPEDDPSDQSTSLHAIFLTAQEQEEWRDVITMNEYLTKGRRPQFWDEPFTKRVMDAIKNKNLEMKKAAKLLGVSYGTLYGRYRETYGCLKHPYRGPFIRWTDQGPNEIIGLLQKGVITMARAAELMNASPTTVNGYLDHDLLTTATDNDLMEISEEKRHELRKAAAIALLSSATATAATTTSAANAANHRATTISPGPSSSSSSSSSPTSKTINLTTRDSKSSYHSKKS